MWHRLGLVAHVLKRKRACLSCGAVGSLVCCDCLGGNVSVGVVLVACTPSVEWSWWASARSISGQVVLGML